jgi:hypothetical protein
MFVALFFILPKLAFSLSAPIGHVDFVAVLIGCFIKEHSIHIPLPSDGDSPY